MKIMLACGGTGGHLFPGIALAQAFQKRRPETEVVFVGTKRGIEDEVLRESLWQLRLIKISSFADRGLWQKFLFFFSLVRGVFSAISLLREEKPDVIVGVGGYVQAPVILAAFLLRKPILLVETNAIPGYSNRYLQFFADRVVVAYPSMEKYFGK
ncbi:MAG: glycosyltransferase, partial [Deltaproteobacteria bacterium]|nr:glycosyltransferase [Deltaproteobacteria bacterium]